MHTDLKYIYIDFFYAFMNFQKKSFHSTQKCSQPNVGSQLIPMNERKNKKIYYLIPSGFDKLAFRIKSTIHNYLIFIWNSNNISKYLDRILFFFLQNIAKMKKCSRKKSSISFLFNIFRGQGTFTENGIFSL